jgi:very-short-patch-repair endonuclease
VLPRDHTSQENIIEGYLSEWGLRYEMQASFPPYTVDFLIHELNMVIEADGIYGHLLTKDRIRDSKLIESGEILIVLHCKETTKSKIKDFLWRELNKLEKPKQ